MTSPASQEENLRQTYDSLNAPSPRPIGGASEDVRASDLLLTAGPLLMPFLLGCSFRGRCRCRQGQGTAVCVHSFLHPPLPPVRFSHQGTCRHVFDVAQGNDWFKKRDYLKAVEWYTRSLQLDPMSAITVANRAMAHLQLKEYVPPPSPPSAAASSQQPALQRRRFAHCTMLAQLCGSGGRQRASDRLGRHLREGLHATRYC